MKKQFEHFVMEELKTLIHNGINGLSIEEIETVTQKQKLNYEDIKTAAETDYHKVKEAERNNEKYEEILKEKFYETYIHAVRTSDFTYHISEILGSIVLQFKIPAENFYQSIQNAQTQYEEYEDEIEKLIQKVNKKYQDIGI